MRNSRITKGNDISIQSLDVVLAGKLIGYLFFISPDQSFFKFSDEYLEDKNRHTLSLSFRTASGMIDQTPIYRIQLPPFFSNLLPEGHLRKYLAEKVGVHSKREFFFLSELGEDLPGAVVVRPSIPLGDPEPHPGKDEEIEADSRFRFSLAGVQLKFSAIREAKGGLTIPATGGGGDWILKLPGGIHQNVTENEFSMLELAKGIGISVPPTQLIDTESIEQLPKDISYAALEGKTFAIRRFDRKNDGSKIHIEDFAQVFNKYAADKYKGVSYGNIAMVVWIECGEDDLTEFVRRLVFNILIGNADMHSKNWSLLYEDGISPRLAPAYDFVSTIVYNDDRTLGLSIAGEKKMLKLKLNDFERFADKARLPKTLVLNTVVETVPEVLRVWQTDKDRLPISRSHSAVIEEHMKSLELVQEIGAI